MALNGGRVGRPVRSSFPPSRSDLPVEVALGGVSRNSSSFKRSHHTVVQRGLDRGQVVARWPVQGRGSSESCSRNRTSRVVPSTCPRCPKNTNKANSWSRSGRLVPSCQGMVRYAIYELYTTAKSALSASASTARPASVSISLSLTLALSLSLVSMSLSMTYKGFHDELAAMSAMVSARLTPPYSS